MSTAEDGKEWETYIPENHGNKVYLAGDSLGLKVECCTFEENKKFNALNFFKKQLSEGITKFKRTCYCCYQEWSCLPPNSFFLKNQLVKQQSDTTLSISIFLPLKENFVLSTYNSKLFWVAQEGKLPESWL